MANKLQQMIDPPLTHCLVDLRNGKPFIVERFHSLFEAIFDRGKNNRHLRIYRCINGNGIQELSRKESAIERRTWHNMVTEEGLRRRQEFEAAEQAKRDQRQAEFLLRQNEILAREQKRRDAEREAAERARYRSLPPLDRLRHEIARKPFTLN
jgi:hypothetical protein